MVARIVNFKKLISVSLAGSFWIFLLLLFSSCEKEISTTQIIEEFPTGSLFIDSYPSNSRIFIDGNNSGYFTPDTINQLELREHSITLKNDLWLDYNFIITPQENSTTEYFADFKLIPGVQGSLEINSNVPAAKVYISGSSDYLITPATKNDLFPGYYLLEGFKEEHRMDSKLATVRSGVTSKANLVLEDTTHWVSYTSENSGLTQNVINNIVVDKNGIKWLATNNGLIKHFASSFIVFDQDNSGIPSNALSCLLVDQKNNLWIGSSNGLIKFDGQSWEIFNTSNSGISSNAILCLDEAPDGKIWLGTLNNGVSSFDGSNWQKFNLSNSTLHSNFITAIAVDSQNNVLVGTASEGLSIYKSGKWYPIINSEDYELPSSNISAIAVDEQDIFWIGHLPTDDMPGGLSRFNGTSVQKINLVGYSSNITNIYIDNYGFKWVSTKRGIIRFNADNIPTQLLDMHFDVISGIVAEREGLYWVATLGGGIAKYKL